MDNKTFGQNRKGICSGEAKANLTGLVVKKKNMVKKLLFMLFVVLPYCVHRAKIHVSEHSLFQCGPVRTRSGVSCVAGRSVRTLFLLLSYSANYQQSSSAAEFSELSAERFSC
jgi:hypothetical protein